MKRPIAYWVLLALLIVLALGGLSGAYGFLSDPSGVGIGMAEQLSQLPLVDYTVPGVLLLVLMFAGPLFLVFGLLRSPRWPWADRLFAWSGHHWAWTGSLILGVGLVLWLSIQAWYIGFNAPIQWFTATLTAAILAFTLMPSVRRSFLQG